MINRNALPRGAVEITQSKCSFATTAGNLKMTSPIELANLILTKFSSLHIPRQVAHVFDDPTSSVHYDLILACDFLCSAGISIDFSKSEVTWLEHTIPMRPHHYWSESTRIRDALFVEPVLAHQLSIESYAVSIEAAKYEATNLNDLMSNPKHLSAMQRADLFALLKSAEPLFSGNLGSYPHRTFSLELKPDAKPFHAKPYAVPHVHLGTFKAVSIGDLVPTGASLWAAGTFIIPKIIISKKNGTVCWISDFCMLNKFIEHKQYPLPQVQAIIQNQCPYKFLTKIDVSMQYYTFCLDAKSSELCTIITPFGKFRYTGLPMGACQSSDFAQATMEEVLHSIDDVVASIDDIKITHRIWDDHLACLRLVLTRLLDNGFTVNPAKFEWAVSETNFLGFWFTPSGPKPWRKKIEAILHIAPPANCTTVRAFCGAITFYRDMFCRRADILAPITALTSKDVPFV